MDGEKNIPKEKENVPEIKRQGWNTEDIAKEGANENPDEVVRRTLRGDEDKADGDGSDIAGSVASDETPHGREESKNQVR